MGNTQFIWGNAKRASYIRQANTKGFQASLDYMPESPLRHFLQWIIEQPNTQLYDRWARLNGMLPVARMTDEVLSGLFPDDMMLKLVDASIPLNVLLTYEVISDNLAIYLTKESTEHPEYQTRAKLLNAFNTIMVQKLRNPGLDTKACLGLHCDLMNTISSYHHSLSANTHRAIHQEYILEYPDADTKALEYDLFPHLVANIEAAANVLNYLRIIRHLSLSVMDYVGVTKEAMRSSPAQRYPMTNSKSLAHTALWLYRPSLIMRQLLLKTFCNFQLFQMSSKMVLCSKP